MKSCFMFGHSDCPDTMLPKIEEAIDVYYSRYGVTDFYIGNRGRFDGLAAAAVRNAKQQHPDIRMYLLLAYHPSERAVDLWGGFDGSFYPPLEGVPRPYTIVRANQYMIDTTMFLICYVKHIGNAKSLLEYARRKGREAVYITNVASENEDAEDSKKSGWG